jgi:hypothetical protein
VIDLGDSHEVKKCKCKECKGKKGDEGERGKRGHKGPQGPTGATGAAGATGATGPTLTPAYGYATKTSLLAVSYSTGSPILFDTPGPLNSVAFNPTGLQILLTGTYHVEYSASSSQSSSSELAFVYLRIRVNGSIPATAQYQSRLELQPSVTVFHRIPQHGSAILPLSAGNLITIVPDGTNNSQYDTAYLQVIQII